MLVLLFADAVELQVHAVLARGLCGFTKLDVFSKPDSVGCGQDAIETNLLGIRDRFQIIRR